MAGILHVEEQLVVALAAAQVRIAALQLHVDLLAAGLAVVVLELDLAVDPLVEHGDGTEDLICLAADGHHVADCLVEPSIRRAFELN